MCRAGEWAGAQAAKAGLCVKQGGRTGGRCKRQQPHPTTSSSTHTPHLQPAPSHLLTPHPHPTCPLTLHPHLTTSIPQTLTLVVAWHGACASSTSSTSLTPHSHPIVHTPALTTNPHPGGGVEQGVRLLNVQHSEKLCALEELRRVRAGREVEKRVRYKCWQWQEVAMVRGGRSIGRYHLGGSSKGGRRGRTRRVGAGRKVAGKVPGPRPLPRSPCTPPLIPCATAASPTSV